MSHIADPARSILPGHLRDHLSGCVVHTNHWIRTFPGRDIFGGGSSPNVHKVSCVVGNTAWFVGTSLSGRTKCSAHPGYGRGFHHGVDADGPDSLMLYAVVFIGCHCKVRKQTGSTAIHALVRRNATNECQSVPNEHTFCQQSFERNL